MYFWEINFDLFPFFCIMIVGDNMKPVIGVVLKYQCLSDGRAISYMSEKVRRTIQRAGGDVFSIVPVHDVDYFYTKGNEFPELTDDNKRYIDEALNSCDGVLFPGGVKFTPFDRYLLEQVIEKKIPVLGICLGMQLMSCYRDDVSLKKIESYLNHNQELDEGYSHKVKIKRSSRLYDILGEEEIFVNSFHKYQISENKYYNISAFSEDGVIEAIEFCSDTFNMGIQWHPEISYEADIYSKKIIDGFIDAAIEKKCNNFLKEKSKISN